MYLKACKWFKVVVNIQYFWMFFSFIVWNSKKCLNPFGSPLTYIAYLHCSWPWKPWVMLFLNKLYWTVVDLQYYVGFCCTEKWNHLYMYIYPLFFFLSLSHVGHYRVEFPISRSLLVIYFIYSRVYMSIPLSQLIPLLTTPISMFVFYICDSFCFVNKFICTIFLDSTYKWYFLIV